MIKKIIYSQFLIIDKIFIYIQFFLIELFVKEKKKYTLINAGWGQLVQSIFYLNLILKKNTFRMIVVLDYDKFNLEIQNFTKNCKIKKIYSIFILVNKNFTQYPKKYELDIKTFCKKISTYHFKDMDEIIYNKSDDFFNYKILSNYILKKISKEKIFSHSLQSLNDQKYDLKQKNFFEPNKESKNKIEKIFDLKLNQIKNSINICVRKRNKYNKNDDRTNYLRDGNLLNFKIIINFLLKHYNYKIFLTGDIDEINIIHKNLFYFKLFEKKISKNFYNLSIQSLSKFHIMNSGGANTLMKFNDCKFLYIDCWPPINFTPDSVILYKNILNKKKKYIGSFKYLRMYVKECNKQKNRNSFKISKKIFIKFFKAKNYEILDNNKEQILLSLKDFLIFINNRKKFNLKNNCYQKVPNYFKKILLENNCFLSSGNLKFTSKAYNK